MAEEFQESEIIFADSNDNCFDFKEMIVSPATTVKSSKKRNKKKKKMANSVPVSIPEIFSRFRDNEDDNHQAVEDEEEEEWNDEDGELVPPHVIVGRRIAGQMAFSVCTGNGRTLKGRDLSQVRNSILRMTGFLET
ncbi:protein S40-1 [Ziziphus jujuba]|uniref:Protein S40-1 n=2 Tax=Ziziphus jujuba TaxID=326968 RepID=A0A6P3ZF82_ZIZJJ|nr:protein S40-1 [Ziziphus jujuba]KAH7545083.1 hypothetical protein FEM48_Zijuj01G0055700 [Ziziphus jujuba var. spinosa]